jgi:uncharacterized membrane protein YhaH (DUF805 family)
MSNYYAMIDGKQQGPFSVAEIRKMNLNPSTFVYTNGFSSWKKMSDVSELNHSSPTPIDTSTPTSTGPGVSSAGTSYNASKGMFQNTFSFDGRIRRTEYGISFIIYFIIAVILNLLLKDGNGDFAIFGIVYIPLLWFILAQGAKRCHDRDNSGWFQIIPFYALWMIFVEGDQSINQYGPSPK